MLNPHQTPSCSIRALISSLIINRQLIYEMTKREVIGRYKGSVLGLAWSLLNPILMLTIYTFVFSVVLKSHWGPATSETKTEFALILFVGMIVFGLFSETINRSPSLILANVNYVKKVVFPLEVLPVINLGVALFHALVGFGVLIIGLLMVNGSISLMAIYVPIIMLPLVFFTLGASWFIASIGVFVRDVSQTVVILTSLMMFLSPVLYPISAVPEEFQAWIFLNPITFIIEQTRGVLVFEEAPDWFGLSLYFITSMLIMIAGFAWFQKTRRGFADVL